MTLGNAYTELKQRLALIGVAEPQREAMLILQAATHKSSSYILAHKDAALCESEREYIKKALACREGGEPLQYVLGRWEFMSLELVVTKDVLIPRADTEILAEAALKLLPKDGRFLDLCTGSGCIAVALLHYSNASGVAVDISKPALDVAKQNARSLGVAERLNLLQADVLSSEGIDALLSTGKYDLIVCNPPYIPTEQLDEIDRQVKDFEPIIALDGGKDGLMFYCAVAKAAPRLLKSGGHLLFEVGLGQAQNVMEIMAGCGFENLFVERDLAGFERVVGGSAPCLQ